MPLNVNMQLIS